jgi:predicted acylesterase/phospholipase RssA
MERLGLALSGGGFRAAAFHLGVLRGLRQAGLLEEVEVVSAVSGGALLAAAWVLHGGDLDAFTDTMRGFLARDLKRRVLVAALRPDRLARLLVDPRYSLTEVLAAVLDREVFGGATLGGLRERRPRLVLNATCVNHGTGWRFTPERMGDWILSTRDQETLRAFPLARAVACSAAFPGGFAPVALSGARYFAGSAVAPREVLLTDGGVDDNLGVQALLAEECTRVVVSDGSFPFATDTRPLDRFGLPYPRRLLVAALVTALAGWAAARLDVPALVLALAMVVGLLVGLRLRFALWLFGSVVMRGQRRALLRRLFAGAGAVPCTYLGLATALESDSERELQEQGIDLDHLRRVRTDLDLARSEVDGLIALGEALARDRLPRG